jgi:hypothetical protein
MRTGYRKKLLIHVSLQGRLERASIILAILSFGIDFLVYRRQGRSKRLLRIHHRRVQ